jgi:hypothetical protein
MRTLLKLLIFISVPAIVGIVWANGGGPSDALTAAPGETTCADCHGNLDSGSGSITITGPASYAPGDTLDLVVSVQQNGRRKWGFEMTALDDSNGPIGNLIIAEPVRTQLSIDGATGREYVKHTAAGTDPGVAHQSPGWTVRWASPATPHGPVTFYAVGCASNNNNATNGDYIYTTAIQYNMIQVGTESESWGAIKKIFR